MVAAHDCGGKLGNSLFYGDQPDGLSGSVNYECLLDGLELRNSKKWLLVDAAGFGARPSIALN